ncbi:MAG: tRNA (N(6)-L-threonylcarbamoyladenosine(37)-C(2))-methylthiotransferase MtaB [Clostridiaceae bacterium]|nr:tRNA (N(6)-L-threonylcarbamoyladenosine(37)-C(2))-methylthiotransferase MtaB [Clostridiaceae bacterium]
MPKLYIHSLGCKTNHYETQALVQQLSEHNFELVEKMQDADVGILNTCTVTAEAGRKSRQFLRRMKKQNPAALIVAMGCYSQLYDVTKDCDIAVGTSRRNSIVDLILNKLPILNPEQIKPMSSSRNNNEKETISVQRQPEPRLLSKISNETEYEELGIVSQQSDTRALIKIQDGCNEFCTYCAIPLARGRIRSRIRRNIVKEAERLVECGFKEIVLTGIHICSFERESGRSSDALAELCLELNSVPGLSRIRLGSLEPLSITQSFLNILRQADKVCPHFHLSLQSGSDSVLKRMHRKYNSEQYLTRVQLLREIYPDPAITTDIMVGFPGETDKEFEQSLAFVKKINFSRIHVFPYSLRPNTLAAKMEQVPQDIVKRRVQHMLEAGEILAAKYAEKFINIIVEVLLEDVTEAESESFIRGYTQHYVRTLIPKKQGKTGEIKNVLISDTQNDELIGRIV